MDAGLQIKELAAMVGVTEDTVIYWEIRGIKPSKSNLDRTEAMCGIKASWSKMMHMLCSCLVISIEIH